jgi:hypothetical protein
MAPIRPHGDKQVGTQVTVTAGPALRGETPFDAARIAHDALDTAGAAQHFQLGGHGNERKPRSLCRSILTNPVPAASRCALG